MSPAPRRARRFNPLHLAGWLFADMLLVLALVSMGDRADPLAAEAAAARPSPSASASASASPSPSPSPTRTGPRSLELKPVKIRVVAAAGKQAAMVRQIREATERHEDREAALVLTFGEAPDTGQGQAYADEVNKALGKARPEMFGDAVRRPFWQGSRTSGSASLEIYFYTR
ncbi:hypothetical protein [Streptomyces sp. MJP52]|uniref:hypothetical protein n=1 Tax=Streptomyces sp. MJP52 TaxID=2940555 RepID=UPI00247526B7|nr:hypothetical protein [Streptomyces sp. MJP52]MDH6226798.1 hypothetical protein [Streptomyces sp. MJP52]